MKRAHPNKMTSFPEFTIRSLVPRPRVMIMKSHYWISENSHNSFSEIISKTRTL